MPSSTVLNAPTPSSTEGARCPLCGGENACSQTQGPAADCADNLTCWCKTTVISTEALARIPADLRGLACICQACAASRPSPAI